MPPSPQDFPHLPRLSLASVAVAIICRVPTIPITIVSQELEEIKQREAEWEAQQVEMAQEAESRKTYRPFKLR